MSSLSLLGWTATLCSLVPALASQIIVLVSEIGVLGLNS
jgi:hypothetical protein